MDAEAMLLLRWPASTVCNVSLYAVLLLKYCFPTGDQLQRYRASDVLQ